MAGTKTKSTAPTPSVGSDDNQDAMLQGIVSVRQRDVTLMLEAGYLCMELKKHKEAEDIFTGVSVLLPHSEVPHMAMGNMLFAQGRFGAALKCHVRATELNPQSATALASCAESLFFLKRNSEALEHLERAQQMEPQGPAHEFALALKEAYDLGIFA